MAKKINERVEDPLDSVAVFHPDAMEAATAEVVIDNPVSPLGPPALLAMPASGAVELLLQETDRQIKQLRDELAAERAERRELEKLNYQLEAEVKHLSRLQAELEAERAARLELERKAAMLAVRAERADDIVGQLSDERQARVALERERATLAVEVEHARKLETFLAEERQARMNAQSRAAAAEARLAKLEGEVAARSPEIKQSLLGRLRGR